MIKRILTAAVVECRAALIRTLRVTKVDFDFALTLGVVFVAAVNLAPMTVSAATVTTNNFTNTSTYDFSTGPSVFSAGPLVRAIGGQNLTYTSTSTGSVFDYTNLYRLAENGLVTKKSVAMKPGAILKKKKTSGLVMSIQ